MWTLRHTCGRLIHISPDTSITIGRKACDLLLQDPAVSKVHASVSVKYTNDVNQPDDNASIFLSTCIITDEGSTRGTKIIRNDKKMSLCPGKGYVLKPDDKIKFGANNIWTVSYREISLLTCGDCIDNVGKLDIVIKKLGGRVFTEWNESCNFYSTICGRVTTKFGIALAAGLPIVTLKYWEDCYESFQMRKEFPDASLYFITNWDFNDELKNISLRPQPERRVLFTGLEFVFFSTFQISYYAKMIELAGGRPLLYSKYGFGKDHLTSENTVIIACNDGQMTCNNCCGVNQDGYREIRRLLAKFKRTLILEMDIVKAIMICSRNKYCNPDLRKKCREKSNQDLGKQNNVQSHQSDQTEAVSNTNNQNKPNTSASRLKSSKSNAGVSRRSRSVSRRPIQAPKVSFVGMETLGTATKSSTPSKSLASSSKAAVQASAPRHQPPTSKNVSIDDEETDNEFPRRPRTRSRTPKRKSPVPIQLPDVTVQLERLSDEAIQAATQSNNVESTNNDNNLNDSRSSDVINSSLNEGNNNEDVTNSNLNEENNKEVRKRKRKISSPNCLITNRDSTPDLFSSGDESSSDRRQQANSNVKIVDDRIIDSRVILKDSNDGTAKKRKVELKIRTSKTSVQENKITNYFVDNHVEMGENIEEEARNQSTIVIDEDETNNDDNIDGHQKRTDNKGVTLVISDDETRNSGETHWIETKSTKVVTRQRILSSSEDSSTEITVRKLNIAKQKLLRVLESDSENVNTADDSLISIESDNSDSSERRLVIDEEHDDAVNNGLKAICNYIDLELAGNSKKTGTDEEKVSEDRMKTPKKNDQHQKILKSPSTNDDNMENQRPKLTPKIHRMKRAIRGIFSSSSDDDHSEASTDTVKITGRKDSRSDVDDDLEMISDDNEVRVDDNKETSVSQHVTNLEVELKNKTMQAHHRTNQGFQSRTSQPHHQTDQRFQSRTLQPHHQTDQGFQSRTPQPHHQSDQRFQSRTPQPHHQTDQGFQSRTPQPHHQTDQGFQSRTPQPHHQSDQRFQSRTPQPHHQTDQRFQSRTPQPHHQTDQRFQSRTPQPHHQTDQGFQSKTPQSYHEMNQSNRNKTPLSQRGNFESPPKSQPNLNTDVIPKRNFGKPTFSSIFGDTVKKPQSRSQVPRNNHLEAVMNENNKKSIFDDENSDKAVDKTDESSSNSRTSARKNSTSNADNARSEANNLNEHQKKVIVSNNIFNENEIPLFIIRNNNNKNGNKDDDLPNKSTDVWPIVIMDDDDLISVMDTVEITTENDLTLSSGTEGRNSPVQKKVEESVPSRTRSVLSENALPSFFSNIF